MIFISLASLLFQMAYAVQNTSIRENNMLLVWILLFLFVDGIGQLICWLGVIAGIHKAPVKQGNSTLLLGLGL